MKTFNPIPKGRFLQAMGLVGVAINDSIVVLAAIKEKFDDLTESGKRPTSTNGQRR